MMLKNQCEMSRLENGIVTGYHHLRPIRRRLCEAHKIIYTLGKDHVNTYLQETKLLQCINQFDNDDVQKRSMMCKSRQPSGPLKIGETNKHVLNKNKNT